jgi:hypothetical protein
MEQFLSLTVICLVLLGYYFRPSQQNNPIAYNIPDPGNYLFKNVFVLINLCLFFCVECTGIFNLCTDVDKERLGRQAIRAIHEQMDDDKDGLIEPSESTDVSY